MHNFTAMSDFYIHNSLTRAKEKFEALNPPYVGMYVCGPTVYGDAHLGHARSALTFDTLFRWLLKSGYKVRYVRNITDVGHLENDADEGEDKIAKFARVAQLEPMEVVQHYTNRYREDMRALNLHNPSIEPVASGHIPEQIELVQKLLDNGFAYVSNGSVYFDVRKYNQQFQYGKLSGRNLDEVQNERDLDGQDDKRFPGDFALWKKAEPQHIMRWKSPWSEGFPGWHLECTVMSTKYLGTKYDIHGGGMDLLFPHHEAEIAQSNGAIADPHSHDLDEARYWMHNNMITVDGQKMGKSLNNFITLKEFFSGKHERLEKGYAPLTIRFFVLQAHYRSTLDFSNAALQAAEKALQKLTEMGGRLAALLSLNTAEGPRNQEWEENLRTFEADARAAMNDDLNTAKVIARMFDASSIINDIHAKRSQPLPVSREALSQFGEAFHSFFHDVLGLQVEGAANEGSDQTEDLMKVILKVRAQVRSEKNFAMSDLIRDELSQLGIQVKDTPQGPEWSQTQ